MRMRRGKPTWEGNVPLVSVKGRAVHMYVPLSKSSPSEDSIMEWKCGSDVLLISDITHHTHKPLKTADLKPN